MNTEQLFTAAREQHPSATRIEVKWLALNAGHAVDDGFLTMHYIAQYLADEMEDGGARIHAVAVCHLPGGQTRFVFGDDYTNHALMEADRYREPAETARRTVTKTTTVSNPARGSFAA